MTTQEIDWAFEFEERAAIMEYDGNMPRAEAEQRARDRIMELKRRPPIQRQLLLKMGRT